MAVTMIHMGEILRNAMRAVAATATGYDGRTNTLEYSLHCSIVLESREDRGYEQYYYKRWNDTSYGGHYASFYSGDPVSDEDCDIDGDESRC